MNFPAAAGGLLVTLSALAGTAEVGKTGPVCYLEITKAMFHSKHLRQVSINTCTVFELLTSEEEFFLIGLCRES